METLLAQGMLDPERVAGQRLTPHDRAQLESEALQWRERARLHVQMLEVDAPARRLAAAMLAHDAVEPAFKTAGQEIGRAHVCTPVTNAQCVCRLLLANKVDSDMLSPDSM